MVVNMDSVAKNLDEDTGFIGVKSDIDNLYYKVIDIGTEAEKKQVAIILSKIRRDLNTLMIYLCKHPEEWIHLPIAYGVMHTFDIHLPCLEQSFDNLIESDDPHKIILTCGKLYTIQEMTPNEHGIIGLNKPKDIRKHDDGYEIATKRSLHLTVRNKGKIDPYSKVLDLALHEITHTTCNDIYWKEDNHKHPFPTYQRMMKEWARKAKIK
jgi:hypothetical protein